LKNARYASVLRWVALVALLLDLNLPAQTRPQPSLQSILARLDETAASFATSIPDFLADEIYVSQELRGAKVKRSVTTVSTLRVLKTSGKPTNESRDIHTINGKAASGDQIHGPFIMNGGFDQFLLYLRTSNIRCYDARIEPSSDTSQITLLFLAKESAEHCSPHYVGETITAILNAQTLHIVRIDHVVPLIRGINRANSSMSADFAQVQLGELTFLLPTHVRSQLTFDASDRILRSDAVYSNFHRLAVTSNIVPVNP
jgi:hypothetical protein